MTKLSDNYIVRLGFLFALILIATYRHIIDFVNFMVTIWDGVQAVSVFIMIYTTIKLIKHYRGINETRRTTSR